MFLSQGQVLVLQTRNFIGYNVHVFKYNNADLLLTVSVEFDCEMNASSNVHPYHVTVKILAQARDNSVVLFTNLEV